MVVRCVLIGSPYSIPLSAKVVVTTPALGLELFVSSPAIAMMRSARPTPAVVDAGFCAFAGATAMG